MLAKRSSTSCQICWKSLFVSPPWLLRVQVGPAVDSTSSLFDRAYLVSFISMAPKTGSRNGNGAGSALPIGDGDTNCYSAIRVIIDLDRYLALNKAVRIIALIVLFGLAIIISVMGILYRNSLRLQGLFLDYSKTFISINPHVLAYIPLFINSNLALLCLFIFQHAAFSSKHNSNSNFFDFSNPGILGWLNLI